MTMRCIACLLLIAGTAAAAPLSVSDFTFEGPLGSQGTTIEAVGENHFLVTLGHAPNKPGWNNKLQFTILQNAKGNSLTLDVVFEGGPAYSFNEYFHSYSYDNETWHPVQWQYGRERDKQRDTMIFPEFTEDRVVVGHQVPMSYEKLMDHIDRWSKSPYVTASTIGDSLEGRPIPYLIIADPDSDIPPEKRWGHFFINLHPGEHNSQWRMVGMIDWLLSEAGRASLQHTTCYFIPMVSPDAPSKGWYRTNAEGIDMNRTYLSTGADQNNQTHEAYLAQKTLEAVMASETPAVTLWGIHTWGGKTDPRLAPGPEMTEKALGSWEKYRDIIEKNDTQDVVIPIQLAVVKKENGTWWDKGAHLQFGITTILCEGGGGLFEQQEHLESGRVLMQSTVEYYTGMRE